MKTPIRTVSDRLDNAVNEELTDIVRHPSAPNWQQCSRNQTWIIAETMLLAGDHANAAEAASELALECPDEWEASYDAACLVARCVGIAQNDARLSVRQRGQTAKAYTRQAVQLLKSAIRLGFHDFRLLERDADLAPLRNERTFLRLAALAGGRHAAR